MDSISVAGCPRTEGIWVPGAAGHWRGEDVRNLRRGVLADKRRRVRPHAG